MASSSWQQASDGYEQQAEQAADVDRPNFAMIPVPLDQDDLDEVADAINRLNHKRFVDHYANKIQRAARRFLAYKNQRGQQNVALQGGLNHPSRLVCPLSMDLFEDPVVAMDGVTYEHREILHFFEHKPNIGEFIGPFRRNMPSKFLVPNLNLRSEVMEYRTTNQLPLPTPQDPGHVVSAPLSAPLNLSLIHI